MRYARELVAAQGHANSGGGLILITDYGCAPAETGDYHFAWLHLVLALRAATLWLRSVGMMLPPLYDRPLPPSYNEQRNQAVRVSELESGGPTVFFLALEGPLRERIKVRVQGVVYRRGPLILAFCRQGRRDPWGLPSPTALAS